jgi:hypothetical protein
MEPLQDFSIILMDFFFQESRSERCSVWLHINVDTSYVMCSIDHPEIVIALPLIEVRHTECSLKHYSSKISSIFIVIMHKYSVSLFVCRRLLLLLVQALYPREIWNVFVTKDKTAQQILLWCEVFLTKSDTFIPNIYTVKREMQRVLSTVIYFWEQDLRISMAVTM